MFHSDYEIGVPQCAVPLYTPGIGLTCLERYETYNCSVVNQLSKCGTVFAV